MTAEATNIVAVFLADRDDEFSWNWLEDEDKDRYRKEAEQLLGLVSEKHVVMTLDDLEVFRRVAVDLVDSFREVENSPNRLYDAPTHHLVDALAYMIGADDNVDPAQPGRNKQT